MNLSTSGLLSSARQDVVVRQLSTTANSGGLTFDPTSRAKVSNHETDKQGEDNQTWFFEYRALLNSKLTTLITSLTSAYTSDLDASMGTKGKASWGANSWSTKLAMQGITGQSSGLVDPGAARSAYAYLTTYFGDTGITVSSTPAGSWRGDTSTQATIGGGVNFSVVGTDVNGAAVSNAPGGQTITGTTTFISGGEEGFILDQLIVGINGDTSVNQFVNTKKSQAIYIPGLTVTKNIGNQMEETLYKFLAKPENLDILRFGLFSNIFVVGTSSIPTGSQIQGSIKLNWDQTTGRVVCNQERYAAFFHS